MMTCSPSVSTQVWVSCGEPSGIRVVRKQGLGWFSRAMRPSGRSTCVRLPSGSPRISESTPKLPPGPAHRAAARRTGRHSAGRSWILSLTLAAPGTAAGPGEVLSPLNFSPAGRSGRAGAHAAGGSPPSASSTACSADEAALVGGDDGLDAVPGAELGQDVADVRLDRLHAQEQAGGDLGIGPAPGDQPQYFGFAVGEVGVGRPVAVSRAAAESETADRGREQQ